MFSGRKEEKPKRARRGGNLAQLGLMDVPGLDNPSDGENDDALEAELLALTGGGGGVTPQGRKKKGKDVVSPDELAKMVSNCMKDDDDDDGDGDGMVDEDDPDLLAELMALNQENERGRGEAPSRAAPAPPRTRNPEPVAPRQAPMAAGRSVVELLAERISMYEAAEREAKASGETSRARRFNRGLKTLMQMQKTAKAGNPINEEDIPPVVLVKGGGGRQDPSHTPSPSEEPPQPQQDQGGRGVSSILHSVAFNDSGQPSQPSQPSQTTPNREPQSPSNPEAARPNPQPQPPSRRATTTTTTTPEGKVRLLHTQYKTAALMAKKQGDREQALAHMRIMKQLEPVLRAAEQGEAVDLTSLPPPPPGGQVTQRRSEVTEPMQGSTEGQVSRSQDTAGAGNTQQAAPPAAAPPAGVGGGGGPTQPTSVLEALQQRLAKYTEQRDKAKSEENSRKERMNQRIMKQYEDAIKKHKAGKPVDFDELPTPPGFAPIPVAGNTPAPPAPAAPAAPAVEAVGAGPSPPKQPKTAADTPAPPPKPAPKPPPKNVRQAPQSLVEKQLALLTRRQALFREAALEAKKRGEIEQAKEYLRMSKGFDQPIEATKGGLPVDMNVMPVPPQEKMSQSSSTDFELVSADDCVVAPEGTSGDVAIIYAKLEEDLIAQIKMCAETREHFKATGDVSSSNRFEQLILHTKKDLDAVRAAFKRGSTPPRFHYENRSFNIIQCNTDVNDSDCEVNILRGINFNVQNPKEVDTYVRIEFPYPSDNPPQDRSIVVKDTNNPEFNHKVVFSIDRKTRALARVFKRQAIKLQVYAKGSWFHRDTVLGSVKVPLVTLETKCTLHDSFDLLDDRKRMVGGKLEVKVRLRNPIVTKQLEKVTEKWLVIDGF